MKLSSSFIFGTATISLFFIINCRLWSDTASRFSEDANPSAVENIENSKIIEEDDSQLLVTSAETNAQVLMPDTPVVLATATPPANLTGNSTLPPQSAESLPAPCSENVCEYPDHFFLKRPIQSPGNDAVDGTYRFGSTQSGRREPHHGVEMLNGYGTPVYAAADGVVVVAGEDRDPISPQGIWPPVYYGQFSNFYGNLVVIEHKIPDEILRAIPDYPQPLYTLYAHLSEISVKPGEPVTAGQEIGKVGMTGVSMGSHLHFEVRLGENLYENSRNPELWLEPHLNENGQPNGGIAGKVIDPSGKSVPVSGIVLQYYPDGIDAPRKNEIYLLSYEENSLLGQSPFHESFAVGDIPPGLYRISFPLYGVQEFLVNVNPGVLSMVEIHVEN